MTDVRARAAGSPRGEEFTRALEAGAERLDIALGPGEIKKLAAMYDALVEWNEKINLTSVVEPRAAAIRHVVDSLTCVLAGGFSEAHSCVDVGSGAGFPGLPLAIHCPSIAMALVESVAKKANFLQYVVGLLGLSNVRIVQSRAEELGRSESYREAFDMAVSRGVADLAVLLEYCLPLVRVGGRFIAMKGPDVSDEISRARAALRELGGEVSQVLEVELPEGVGRRTLVLVEKASPCPVRYPRRPGISSKRPIA